MLIRFDICFKQFSNSIRFRKLKFDFDDIFDDKSRRSDFSRHRRELKFSCEFNPKPKSKNHFNPTRKCSRFFRAINASNTYQEHPGRVYGGCLSDYKTAASGQSDLRDGSTAVRIGREYSLIVIARFRLGQCVCL